MKNLIASLKKIFVSQKSNDKLRIVFFGSGDFPIPTLKHLLEDEENDKFNIVGVVTSKDKQYLYKESIYSIARNNNIPVIVSPDTNNNVLKSFLYSLNADVFCVMSYKKLSDDILSIAKETSFNIHGSLLPILRGAAPIQWALRHGLKYTGITSFLLSNEIDCGPIISNRTITITEEDDYGSLLNCMSKRAVNLVIHTLYTIYERSYILRLIYQPYIVKKEGLFVAPKITNDNIIVDWGNYHSEKIINYIKSVSPFFGVPTYIHIYKDNNIVDNISIKIYKAHICDEEELYQLKIDTNKHCDTLLTDYKSYLIFKCIDGKYIKIDRIQLSGKKVMNIDDFLHGFKYCRKKEYKFSFGNNHMPILK